MNTVIQWTVPGKLLLAGEYSVLAGSRALVQAVSAPGGRVRWRRKRTRSMLENGDAVLLLASCLRQEPAEMDPKLVVPAAVIRALCQELQLSFEGESTFGKAVLIRLTAASSEAVGLGGSAREAVCTALALADALGLLEGPEEHWLELVERVAAGGHRLAQGGGSGVDVQSVLRGGLILTKTDERARSVELAREIRLVAALAPRRADTRALLEHFQRARPAASETLRAHSEASEALIDALLERAEALDEAVRRSRESLLAMDRAMKIGIHTRDLDILLGEAERLGVPAKISGAGGGDRVLAFVRSEEEADRIVAAWKTLGYPAAPIVPAGPPTRTVLKR